jgi:hypothetical protein
LNARARAAALGGALALAAALGATLVQAQRVDPKRPTTLTVGPPRGTSPAARVDGRRTGLARHPLPTGQLHVAWQRTTGASLEGAPLVDARGDILLGTGRGEVIALDPEDGLERPHGGVLGAAPLGAMAILSDRTVVYVTAACDALGSRDGALRFRTRVGDGRLVTERSGALALDDGGVAVACGTELATLDAEGHVRARASLDDAVSVPLLAAPGKIAAITTSGRVFAWAPGREPVRVGSFGGPIDGGAVLADDHTLLAIVGGQQLVELDLASGVTAARMGSPGILFGPPALRGDTAYLLAGVPGRTFALAIDGSGQETARVTLVTTPTPPARSRSRPPKAASASSPRTARSSWSATPFACAPPGSGAGAPPLLLPPPPTPEWPPRDRTPSSSPAKPGSSSRSRPVGLATSSGRLAIPGRRHYSPL